MNNKTDIDVQYVSPLKKICMTIGELPSSYLETMSYYEMLVWFTEFLKNKVIPTVNNNAEAVQELQTLYEELRTYVNNYFDNLDVQEEINNKLDAMAESGQLTDIIAQYLGLAGMIAFDTVADMKLAENLVNGSKCRTLGHSSYNDGGGAYYRIRQVTNDDVIDEKTIIAVYDDLLVAELLPSSQYLDIRQVGLFPNTGNIVSVPLYNAFNIANSLKLITYIPKGTYIVKSAEIEPNTSNPESTYALIIPENSEVYFEKGSVIKLVDDAVAWSRVVSPDSNVIIHGELTIDGNCSEVTSGNEHMAGLFIYNKDNISIDYVHSYNCYGDNVQISGNEDGHSNIFINEMKCEKAGRKNLVFESGHNVHIVNAILDNTTGNSGNSWEGGNSLDIEPFSSSYTKDLTIDRIETFGTGNDFTAGTTQQAANSCIVNFNTFIQHGGELLSYSLSCNIENLIFYNAKLNLSYSANFNIKNMICYDQDKQTLVIAATTSGTPILNIETLKVYGLSNTALPASDALLYIQSSFTTIKNIYVKNYYQRCLYFYANYGKTSVYIDNIVLDNCGYATGNADTNSIIIYGYTGSYEQKVFINNLVNEETRTENLPNSVIKYLQTLANPNMIVNNAVNNASYTTLNTRYGNFVPVLGFGGLTTERPTNPYRGIKFYDTTLNKYITHDGTNWVNIDGSSLG